MLTWFQRVCRCKEGLSEQKKKVVETSILTSLPGPTAISATRLNSAYSPIKEKRSCLEGCQFLDCEFRYHLGSNPKLFCGLIQYLWKETYPQKYHNTAADLKQIFFQVFLK